MVLEKWDIELEAIGGGYGCTRINFQVRPGSEKSVRDFVLAAIQDPEFLNPASGEISFDIIILNRPYLRIDLRTRELELSSDGNGLLLFYSYSHSDETHRNRLMTFLAPVREDGLIREWHDRKITPGQRWDKEISEHLRLADIVLLLISADFMASNYAYGVEAGTALIRHDRREVRVIPVIVRPCDWEDTPIGKLQAVPRDGKAVTKWRNRDEAWTVVAKEIRKAIQDVWVSRSLQ